MIIPALNEEPWILGLLEGLSQQSFPLSSLEVLVADGGSTDDTRGVVQRFSASHPEMSLRLIDNPGRTPPAALNRGIAASAGDIIVRLDAHSLPAADYIERCVDLLLDARGDVVGGTWEPMAGSDTVTARGIARAMTHPMGVPARYRFATEAGEAEAVPFGAYFRSLFDLVGPYDEGLPAGEDNDFYYRVRALGRKIYLDPEITFTYFARPAQRELASQYRGYGVSVAELISRRPAALRIRQLAPAALVSGLSLGTVASTRSRPGRAATGIVMALYGVYLAVAGASALREGERPAVAASMVLAIANMHLAYGVGFLIGITRSCFARR